MIFDRGLILIKFVADSLSGRPARWLGILGYDPLCSISFLRCRVCGKVSRPGSRTAGIRNEPEEIFGEGR